MISFREMLIEARFETEIHKNPSTQALKNMVDKFPMRYTIDRAGNMYAGHAEHHTHVDLSDYREHRITGTIYKHPASGEHQFTAAPNYHHDADKIESHPHIKRLMKAGFKRGNEEEDESGVYESLANWRKAYGAHDVEERGAGNKLWKHRKAIAAVTGAGIAASIASKDYGMAALNVGNALQLAGKHFSRIREIKKKYDEADKREAEHKEFQASRAKFAQETAARKLMAKQKRPRKAKPKSVEEDWKSSWEKAGEDPAVRRTGLKATGAAVRTAKNIGRGIIGGALLGTPGGPETMKVTVPFGAAFAAAGSTVSGDIPSAAYQGSKYLIQRGLKTAVNRFREKRAESKRVTT